MTVTHIIDTVLKRFVCCWERNTNIRHKGPNIGHKGPAYVNKGPKTTDRGPRPKLQFPHL